MRIGLRIDVDTYRGTRNGVPALCRLLVSRSIAATFFFSVGPDNMGRHLRRLIRPAFFMKMLRTRASSLYGWDILLRGTFRQGPVIGDRLAGVIRAVSERGHETGLHGWDHHAWQARIDAMSRREILLSLRKGVDLLARVLGRPPDCSAVPAWKCNDLVLREKSRFPFSYNSDCRGETIFYPVVKGEVLSQPQVPVTLPTYDEVIGRAGISAGEYNDYLLSLLDPARLNVLAIHAEVEGIACLGMFERFLDAARARGASFVPLGALLRECSRIDKARLLPRSIPGREGWAACQSGEEKANE
jgi:undecaprenyl phosphate-alpha-L-ara4FN deformylase